MTNANDARKAHKILDDLFKGNMVLDEEREFLRRALPEQPKQKTLAEIIAHVNEAWAGTRSNTWWGDGSGVGVYLEDWLSELREQLRGLKDEPANTPALPAGMRLADHEQYGRVITSPKPNRDGIYDLLVPRPKFETGADWEYAHECELTFIDAAPAAPAEPAHPEFLETEADYTDVPEGTILTMDGLDTAWVKKFDGWTSTGVSRERTSKELGYVRRRVLRWGWGK